MSKITGRWQLTIPKNIIETVNVDFNSGLRIYVCGHKIFIDNPSPDNYHIPCFGPIRLSKNHVFVIPQMLRSIFNLKVGDSVMFYIYKDKLAFKRIFKEKK